MNQTPSSAESSRYSRGWEKLREIDGQAGEHVVARRAPHEREVSHTLVSGLRLYAQPGVRALQPRAYRAIAALRRLVDQGQQSRLLG